MSFTRWRHRVAFWLRRVFHARDLERDLDDELRDHIESQTVANVAAGMTPDAARRAALIAFGGVERAKDESRDVRRVSFGDGLASVRHATRSLRHAPAFTIASVATIALAIGAGSTVFTLVDTVLLRPLPYPESDRLVGLWHTFPGIGLTLAGQADGTYLSYQNATHSFESIGAYVWTVVTVDVPDDAAPPERAQVAYLTASLFRTLRARPLVGRLFTDADEQGNAHPAVLSEEFWRARFDADPAVVGRTIRIDGVSTQIVGVMPASFAFPRSDVRVWFPLSVSRTPYLGYFNFRAVGRLRPGVTIAAAQHELQQTLMRLPDSYPEQRPGVSTKGALETTRARVVIHRLRDDAIGGVAHSLWLVAGVVAMLVLVGVSNIASLTLARLERRQRELALRLTLGASRARVWWNLAGESAIVAVLGSALGLSLGLGAFRYLAGLGPTTMLDPQAGGDRNIVIPRLAELHPNAVFVLTGLALTVAFCLVSASIGAWRLASSDTARLLREGGRGGTPGGSTQRIRSVLVAADVALSLVLLAGSSVLGRSVLRLVAIEPGFDATDVVTAGVTAPPWIYRSGADVDRFYRATLAAVRGVTGVRSAALSSKVPLDGWWGAEPVFTEGASTNSNSLPPLAGIGYTSSDYFATMGIPLVLGRSFDDTHGLRSVTEAVVTRELARRFWHDSTGRRALGKRIRADANGPWYTIVGVAGDVRDTSLTSPPTGKAYFPGVLRSMSLVVRTRGRVAGLAQSLERAVHSVDPSAPVADVRPMTELVWHASSRTRFALLLVGIGAITTLTLGVVGLYGVIAYVVGFRSREIGIRIALGLQPNRAVRMIVRQGAVVIAVGTAAGLAAFVAFARLLRAVAFEVSVVDVASLSIAAAIVALVSTVATWAPARRAGRIDPAEALKTE